MFSLKCCTCHCLSAWKCFFPSCSGEFLGPPPQGLVCGEVEESGPSVINIAERSMWSGFAYTFHMPVPLILIQQLEGMCLCMQRQGSPRPWGAFELFLHFFSVRLDREETAACQVAHRGCSVPALKKTTATPEVYWL